MAENKVIRTKFWSRDEVVEATNSIRDALSKSPVKMLADAQVVLDKLPQSTHTLYLVPTVPGTGLINVRESLMESLSLEFSLVSLDCARQKGEDPVDHWRWRGKLLQLVWLWHSPVVKPSINTN